MVYRLLGKGILSSVLLGMAASLIWYGINTNRIAAKDWEFQLRHPSSLIFPEVLLLKGNMAYYVNLDGAAAADAYREAVSRDPVFIEAWLALAKAEQALGHEDEAVKIIETISPLISHVSTWKWQELLLAFEMRNEAQFADCFNFILAKLPNRISEACYLALSFWGNWSTILPHVTSGSRLAFLDQLMNAKEVDVALSLWEQMEGSDKVPGRDLRLRFCQFLIGNGRVGPATTVWKSWTQNEGVEIHDGGFEAPPLNRGFGWLFGRHPEVSIERSLETPYQGSHCLNIHFRGTQNVVFNHVTQIVPVEPDRSYVLRFAWRSRNLNTDQGVFVNVSGFRCNGLNVQSEPALGSSHWTKEEMSLTVPATCQAIQIQVRRKESLKFDNKIAGDYWIDAVELQPEK